MFSHLTLYGNAIQTLINESEMYIFPYIITTVFITFSIIYSPLILY